MESTLPKLLRYMTGIHAESPIMMHKDAQNEYRATTFAQFYDQVRKLAIGLQTLGVKRGDRVGLISDNRREWLISDLALISLGAADVPRGCDSNSDEIAYILSFSQCSLAILEDARQLDKVLEKEKDLPELEDIIILDRGFQPESVSTGHFNIHLYDDISARGENADLASIDEEIDKGHKDDVATIIYTSGTTGVPKGVMLTNGNFLYQLKWAPGLLSVKPGDRWLSILPVWHAFERIMQYVAMSTGSTLCYSKPIGSILMEDMQKVKPTWMASVPRIWESVRDGVYRSANQSGGVKKFLFHFFVIIGSSWKKSCNLVRGLLPRFRKRNRILDFMIGLFPFILLWPLKVLGSILVFQKIMKKLGGKFVAGISGGGGLPAHVDAFFQAVGIVLIEGYGLTESAPVLTLRSLSHPVSGTIGSPLTGTEIKIVGEDGSRLGPGKTGVLHARGPQIMKGYFKRDDLTAATIDEGGWLNTGDLAVETYDGEFAIVGRVKDTIVLLGGENVEPAPIEEKLKLSNYIESGVVVGQDRKYIGALIQLNKDNISNWARANNMMYTNDEELLTSPEVHELISEEIAGIISMKKGFKIYEKIVRFAILPQSFEPGRELSAKQEIKRHVINEIYAKEIEALFV